MVFRYRTLQPNSLNPMLCTPFKIAIIDDYGQAIAYASDEYYARMITDKLNGKVR